MKQIKHKQIQHRRINKDDMRKGMNFDYMGSRCDFNAGEIIYMYCLGILITWEVCAILMLVEDGKICLRGQ
jgi:hypothetical protein